LLALAAAVALLGGSARADALDPIVVIAALLALLAGVVANLPVATDPIEVGIDHAGALTLRRGNTADRGPEPESRCVFATPWLITIKRGTMLVPIWPDAVPGNTYRRLWVHIRWSSGRQPAGLPSGGAPGRPE
jgi:hypothetical protein